MTSFKEFVGKASTDSYTGQSVYKVTATGLEPNTVYYYVYGSNGKFSSPVMYRTLSTEKFKLLYISDIQVSSDVETDARKPMSGRKLSVLRSTRTMISVL